MPIILGPPAAVTPNTTSDRATAGRSSGRVRALHKDDIPKIAALHDRIVGRAPGKAPGSTEAHFTRIFLRHPWHNPALPSLVYETDSGEIAGCVGIMPRVMRYGGAPITVAVTHNFMVAPDARTAMAGLQLAQRVLAGPQDMSLAEGNNISRRIWERFGGSVSLLYSLHWTRPLRPAHYVLSLLDKRGLPGVLITMLRPLCSLADAMLPRLLSRRFSLVVPDARGAELDAATMCAVLDRFGSECKLSPAPDVKSLSWQLQALEARAGQQLHRVLVCGAKNEVLGFYLYYADKARATGTLVQLCAISPAQREAVLDHLFDHARQQGLCAVSGHMDPTLFPLLAKKQCVFHHDGNSWLLVHSRRPELVHTVNAGLACLSPLEGEWWVNYING
ncbi:MAG: hypothetical protein RLZZ227_1961 [Pseudomonadota bacterium]